MDISSKKKTVLKTPLLIFLFGVSLVWLLCCCRSVPESQVPSTVSIIGDPDAQQKLLLIIASSYPDKISSVEFLNNDWTMLVCGERFYFARGRFLPEKLREQWEEYYPYDFYTYPWTGTARQRRAAFEYPVYSIGSSFLFDVLYASPTEDDSWDWQEKYSFLGVKMLIHPHVKPLFDRVSDRIRDAAQTDPSVEEWIAELKTGSPGGWNWRSIANTNRRSNHSYGIAVDLLPGDLRGRLTYWQWNASDTIDGAAYYTPPEAVIKAFEDHGFIWGGKWNLFDTMHFEYRPEILLLNGFVIDNQH